MQQAGVVDAVAMAAFAEKKWLWVPDGSNGYIQAHIIKENGDEVTVKANDDKERTVNINDTQKMNPPKFDKAEDMADLAYLNEASVVHNLRLRYLSNLIYTYSGLFLVAVNPYHKLPIYSDQVVKSYKNKKRSEMPPHVYAITDAAYRDMVQDRENQSILITGESGAGKTENTKKVIQYLASIAIGTSGSTPTQSADTLEQQILQANPILESFGNAQTIRNNNSSRFGKFIRIEFNKSGLITGANIEKYLLEKSRVTHQTAKERNYHIFYQLLKGASKELKATLLLENTLNDYTFTKASNKNIDGVDDVADFKALKESMVITGIEDAEQLDYFRVIAAVLLLGNIHCTKDREDQAQIPDTSACEKVCHVLSLPVAEFVKGLVKPRVKAGREWVTQSRTVEQVAYSLEALARALYERMFSRLVERLNAALDRPSERSTFIGVLDIAGFEIFDVNSFEQLCINYTNERLQQFFNHHMFILEQEEYKREGIEWKFIDFGLDLQPTIDLIEKTNPIGVLSCLDEECVMPKATDKTFTEKLHSIWKGKSSKYEVPRFQQEGFILTHYADKVEYRTTGWLDKNKDPLNDNITKLLAASTDKFIAALFADCAGDAEERAVTSKSSMVKKGAFRTVAQRHKEQLTSLMTQLYSTQPHFVRCIIPNEEKRPGKIDVMLVLDQLRCNGVLEGIRICRAGYPNRLLFAEFRQRYEILQPGLIPKGFMDGRKATQSLLEALKMDTNQYRIGSSKVFFKAGVLAELEEIRDRELARIMSGFQAQCRGFLARKMHRRKLDQVKAIRILQRNARVYVQLREWSWWRLYSKVKPLLNVSRVDEELRRKEEALAELKEQTKREQDEKERLLQLKNDLENEKRQYEELLRSEQSAAADQNVILARAQERVTLLEDELRELNKDYEHLEADMLEAGKARVRMELELNEVKEQLAEELATVERLEKEKLARDSALKTLETDMQSGSQQVSRLETDKKALESQVNELTSRVTDVETREADLVKHKKRLDAALSEMEEKSQRQEGDIQTLTQRRNALENELKQAKDTSADLQRAKLDLEALVKKREAELESVGNQLKAETAEKEGIEKARREAQIKMQALEGQLDTERAERDKLAKQKKKLESEFEDLRRVVDDKNDQESKLTEIRRMREAELGDLKGQVAVLQTELDETRKRSTASVDALKKEVEGGRMERDGMAKQKTALEKKVMELQMELEDATETRNKLDKAKRQLDGDLTTTKQQLKDVSDKVAELQVSKDALEKQVAVLANRADDNESQSQKLDKEKSSLAKQLESARDELEEELRKKAQIDAQRKKLNVELSELQDRYDAQEASKAEAERKLAQKTQELDAFKERFQKEVGEKVAELEENKRKLEKELSELHLKLAEMEQQVGNLEKSKLRLTNEVEDLRHEIEREHAIARQAEKMQRQLESELNSTNAQLETERRMRENVEAKCRTLQSTVDSLTLDVEDKQQALQSAQRAKADLEAELKGLITEIGDGGKNVHDLEKAKKKLEAQLEHLQVQLDEEEASCRKAEEGRKRAEDQLAEYRQKTEQELAAKEAQFDETRRMLMKEVNSIGQQLDDEMAARNELLKVKKKLEADLAELTSKEDTSAKSKSDMEKLRKKTEASLREVQMKLDTEERARRNFEEMAQRHEKKAMALQADLEKMDQQLEALERDKKRAEKRAEDLFNELEGGEGGPKAQLLEAKKKLEKDVQRLREELEQEQELRHELENKRPEVSATDAEYLKGRVKEEYEGKIEKLEESRRALQAMLRVAQQELEQKQRDIETLDKQRKLAQLEVDDLKTRLESEMLAKNDESAQKRKLASENKELSLKLEAEVTKTAELNETVAMYRTRADGALSRLEGAELAKIKLEKSESTYRSQVKELEETLSELSKDKKLAEDRVKTLEQQVMELQDRLEDESAELADASVARRRLTVELSEERERHKREIEERDVAEDQTKKRLQNSIKELSAELDLEKRNSLKYRDELNRLEAENSDIIAEVEEERRNKLVWLKDKERLETKAADISKQYADALTANDEYQNQITSLISQVREVRTALIESDSQKESLGKAKRVLEQRVEELQSELTDSDQRRVTATTALVSLEQEVASLRNVAAEHEEEANVYNGKFQRSELALQQALAEVTKYKDINNDLERARVSFEKQVKELSLRVVELEASITNGTAGAGSAGYQRLQQRVEELTAQLDKETRDKEEVGRNARKTERVIKDLQYQLGEKQKIEQRFKEDTEKSEKKLRDTKARLEELEMSEQNLQLAKKRLERELQEAFERSNRLESEAKRLKTRGI
ncbi:class II myosin [Sorochytrium milnesiophthora]